MGEQLLNQYTSSVFACETTKDSRYVRCDFNQCTEHPLNQTKNIPVAYWYLNTPQNVRLLEKHVTQQIECFMKSKEEIMHSQIPDDIMFNVNHEILHNNCSALKGIKKVLIIFSLKDSTSNMNQWVDLFLKAVVTRSRTEYPDFICIGLSFETRKELLFNITKLKSIRETNRSVEVMVVLSCHSSSQGQVFSCTPSRLTKEYKFEEFCSIHDFVCSCQDIFGDQLKVIHISSCFALKLDVSHREWPVSITWYQTEFNCILSGSAKEVYETGSQTADLYLILNTILNKQPIVETFKDTIRKSSMELFPDLCKEMGLCTIEKDIVGALVENEDRDDKVTPPKSLNSTIHLLVIYDATESSQHLRNGIYCNLQTRIFTNLKDHFHTIEIINMDEFDLKEHMKDISSLDVFVLVLGRLACEKTNHLLCKIFEWTVSNSINLYGIHFTELSINNITIEPICPITAFLGEYNDPINFLPVLLYLIHLSLGENAVTKTGDFNSTGCWSLVDVYNEISYVLKGLGEKSRFTLLSSIVFNKKNSLGQNNDFVTCGNAMISLKSNERNDQTQKKFDSSKVCELVLEGQFENINTTKIYANQRNEICFNDTRNLESITANNSNINSNKEYKNLNYIKNTLVEAKKNNPKKLVEDSEIKELQNLTKNLKDVPLMANVDEVHVYHYALDLDVNFSESRIDGNILLLIKPTNEICQLRDFQMCLDCTLINILSVKEVNLPSNFFLHFQKDHNCCRNEKSICSSCDFLWNYSKKSASPLNYTTLSYATYGWCVRIWNETTPNRWPQCVWISYQTKAVGPSLTWRRDDDGSPCCFTPGAYINNRSMMPCQEPPVAMSTWQAILRLPKGMMALSSGDICKEKEEVLKKLSNNEFKDTFYFEMGIPLPSSTLAFAFGNFIKSSRTVPMRTLSKVVDVTLYACASKITSFEREYLDLSCSYLVSACELLGEYPFSRLDLVIMPRCFACMGLASPNLIFLSPSILCGDGSMSTRIAHEISHAWFGLVLGAKDWTEEWLSEGFATFLEDRILAHDKKMTSSELDSYNDLVQLLRYRVLTSEINEVHDDNLKLLRPQRKKNYITAIEAVNLSIEDATSKQGCSVEPHSVVPNAAIASKKFSQVHYLKGYFLLVYLCSLVGNHEFTKFLKSYLDTYAYSLVTSEMFFDMFIKYFNMHSSLKSELMSIWLENPSLPKELTVILKKKEVSSNINAEFSFWKNRNAVNKRLKSSGRKRKKHDSMERSILAPIELVLLLEKLLEIDVIVPQTLTQLNNSFNFPTCNAEVRHRWCELVVKHKYVRRYCDVEKFLTFDQGMGIYLFAELILYENNKQKEIAKNLFHEIQEEMDCSTRETVREIIFGEDDI